VRNPEERLILLRFLLEEFLFILEEERVLVKNYISLLIFGEPEGVFFHGASEQECSLRISQRSQAFYPINLPRSDKRAIPYFFFLIFILKIRGWDGEHVRWVPPVFFLPASRNFYISMKDKEETCAEVKQSEEKKDSCVHACYYLVEYSQSSSECIEIVIKSAGPSGSFKKQGAFAVRVRDKRREMLRRTVRNEHCANYDSP